MGKYKSNSYNNNFNLVLYVSVILAGIGIMWLSLNNIEGGVRYVQIFLVMSMLFLLGFLFIKEDDKIFMKKLMKAPFSTDYDIAIPLYFLGILSPFVINFVAKLFNGSFSIAQAMIPLGINDINNGIAQSFSIAQTQTDPFWNWFITVFTASAIEELTFGLMAMFIFSLFGVFVLKMLNDGKDLSFMKAETFYLTFGLISSMLMFGGLHLLNNTYVGTMFIIAMLFRLIMNVGIYVWGLFISFTLGFHLSNNAIYYWNTFGADATINALLTIKGLIILFIFTLMIFYILRRFPIIISKFSKYLGDLG